ncbi:site-specific DNA-methyltransferase [Chloroflexus sp. MS-G]|uniref:site-specific DNA-methyltransferase n=1 Tax=Chloroflexus sp. MS-G TaxID=1521187 RepID=UPI0004DEDCB8|nr:site-specific DNA-methyltransferase [Chloroflexus sp. MS-G]
MNENQIKFQSLLRELFQFDSADLDFGIYRIMNHKRAVIERFITTDLPRAITEELERGALAEQAQAAQALEAARKKVLEALGDDALDAHGNLDEAYRNTKAGKEYLAAQQQAAGSRSREALEAAVYNHLYTFFSRYWQEGDFISKRRYSKKERYAIPYNGEEVYLYWANHDQYYIKTGEYFTDYTYKAPNGVTVHFKLRQADVEQNNVKGEKRFFLPRLDEITCDTPPLPKGEGSGVRVIIPFEYRPLTAQEAITYGQKNQQETILAQAVAEIPKRVKALEAIAALTAERRTTGNGETVPYLEYHLRQYTRRNTSDFFIHKDLKGFLSRELDFYLKNEVLNLDEMEAAGEHLAEGWFQLLRLIKRIGLRIIEFLAQIEDFQKMLWEKKKFVTEVFYLVTVGHVPVPEAFYAEIAACEAQWDEWKTLFAIDELPKDLLSGNLTTTQGRIDFLKAHPTLVVDTRHFPQDFTDRLLASFDDLDEMTDGLLVHSENWQALNLLQEKYRERVKCIYIDPPYNTAASEILYKNDYKHSSWLSLIHNRLSIGRILICNEGVQFTTIDDAEFYKLMGLITGIFGEENIIGVVTIKNNPSGRSTVKGISIAHEYGIISARSELSGVGQIPRTGEQLSQYPEEDESGKYQWRNFLRAGGANDFRSARPRLHYPLIVSGNKVRLPEMEWDPFHKKWNVREKVGENDRIIWPVSKGVEYTWRLGHETLRERLNDLRVRKTRDGDFVIELKFRLGQEGVLPKTIWDEKEVNATAYGTTLLRHLLGESQAFSFPKSVYAVGKAIRTCGAHDEDFILDYFAGSGTTGHAVIALNREDGGRRKFILVEMADYFDTVLLPRIKKVTFTPEWKDGKPKRMATPEEAERSPRIVKVIRLESYEDALNNLTFDDASSQQALELFRDDYLLSYMLKWETRHSETLLNVEQLQAPFSYKLHLHRDGETRQRTVDLPETFAYLLGLDVQTRRVLPSPSGRGAGGEGRYLVYRGRLRNGRTVVILWRDITGWGVADYEREAAFVAQQNLTAGADEIYVNGDSRIPGARSLDPIFKERMFAPVEG